MDRVGGSLLTYRRLNTVPPDIIHGVGYNPMDDVMDVQGGRVPAGPQGGDGGWDEHPGGLSGVRPAPGHGAQDDRLLGPSGLPAAESAQKAQAGALHRRHRPDTGVGPERSQEAAPHGEAGTPSSRTT